MAYYYRLRTRMSLLSDGYEDRDNIGSYPVLPTNNTRAAGRLFQMVPIALRAVQKFQVVPSALRAFQRRELPLRKLRKPVVERFPIKGYSALSSLSVIIRHYPALSVNIRHYLLLSGIIRH